MSVQDEMKKIYRTEALELIDRLTEQLNELLDLEPGDLKEAFVRVMHMGHNLKGASATVNEKSIEKLAHALESVFSPLLDEPQMFSEDIVKIAMDAVFLIHRMVDGEYEESEYEQMFEKLVQMAPAEFRGRYRADQAKGVAPSKSTATKGSSITSSSVKIDTDRLDHLMSFAGELLVSKARMVSHHGSVDGLVKKLVRQRKELSEHSPLLDSLIDELRPISKRFGQDVSELIYLTDEIGDALKKTRMVPLKAEIPLWRRIIQDSANFSDKEVRLEAKVGEVELDKYVVDKVREPLMHILRNAVDHGIEAPEERIQKEKEQAGKILIQASVRGAYVRLEISDDGKGVDWKTIGKSAVEKGVLTEEAMNAKTPGELLEMIFHPGFSTAGEVSRMSGRGVGMDIVRSEIEHLGGFIDISSSPTLGGATFILSIPLSILSITGLFVRVSDFTYAMPVEYVERIIRAREVDIKYADKVPAITPDDGEPLPLVWLSQLVGLQVPREDPERKLPVLILSKGHARMGLVVDSVIGKEEFITQSLPWNYGAIEMINGVIIQADGSTALLLDIPRLFEEPGGREGVKRIETPLQAEPEIGDRGRVLVVDDSLTSRTLEREMLEFEGYSVTVAVDGEDAWSILEKEKFDLIVSDIQMPKLDGFGLTERIRQHKNTVDVPVILISNLSRTEDIARGVAAGADEYIVKGTFDQEILREIVQKYIG